MSHPFPPKTYLTVLAVVSALLILKARRAPKKLLLLRNLRDAAAHVDAGDVTGQLFDSEYDIIIVGGGDFPLSLFVLAPSPTPKSLQEPRAVFSPLVSPRNPVCECCCLNLGKGMRVVRLIGCPRAADVGSSLPRH